MENVPFTILCPFSKPGLKKKKCCHRQITGQDQPYGSEHSGQRAVGEMWPGKRRWGGTRLHLHEIQLQMGRLQKAGGQLSQRNLGAANDFPPCKTCGYWGQSWSPERVSSWHRRKEKGDAGRMRGEFRREKGGEREGREV